MLNRLPSDAVFLLRKDMKHCQRYGDLELHRHQAVLVELELNGFGIASRRGFGMMVRRLSLVMGCAGMHRGGEAFHFMRMKMPRVVVRLQFVRMCVNVSWMVMEGEPDAEVERPQQDEEVDNQ